MSSALALQFQRTMPTGYVRLYSIDEAPPSLFPAALALVICQGRMGRSLRRREETFASKADLVRRVRSLVTLRLRHGYTATAGDPVLFDMRRRRGKESA